MEDYLELKIEEELTEIIQDLEKFLNECNVEVSSKTLYSMIRGLDKIIAIRKGKSYIGVTLNSNGYVQKINKIDTIVAEQELPTDILRGYYKIEDGKLILDEQMREKLWR